MCHYSSVRNPLIVLKRKDLLQAMVEVIEVPEKLVVGQGVIEVEDTPMHIPRVGKTWMCLDCGALIRLNGHHQGPRHGILFVDGQPHYYHD